MKEFEKSKIDTEENPQISQDITILMRGWKGQFIKIGGKSGKMQNSERGLPILSG